MFKVVLYETEDGKTPVEDWIISLDPKMRAKLIAMLEKNHCYKRLYKKTKKNAFKRNSNCKRTKTGFFKTRKE